MTLATIGGGGAVIEDAMLTDAAPASELEITLGLLQEGAERSTPDSLAERLTSAVAETTRAGLAVSVEAGMCVPVVARAITGDAGALGKLDVDPETMLDDDVPLDAEDDDAADEALLDDLIRDYGRFVLEQHGDDSAVWRHGEFISCSLVDWKRDYALGSPMHWTAAEVGEFLLEYAPRKMTMEPEAVGVLADCVIAFVRFLDADGRLTGDSAGALTATCQRVRPASIAACHDPECWGMAKSMAMAMIADGVDPSDPDESQAWIAAYNLRLLEAQTPPAGALTADRCRPSDPSARRAKRGAAKKARRRNR